MSIKIEIKTKIFNDKETPHIYDNEQDLPVAEMVCDDDKVHNIIGVDSQGTTLRETARHVVGHSDKFGGNINGKPLTNELKIDAGTAIVTYTPTDPKE